MCVCLSKIVIFFFKQKTAYEMRISDWSTDVCSSDLGGVSSGIEGLDKAAVTLAPGDGRADSSLKRLTVGGEPFYVLKQRGRFPDIAYDHARLLDRKSVV